MPLARRIHAPVRVFSERAGIGFIGGFAHAPNLDAVRHFLQDIWPIVQAALPGCMFSIVGPDAPADLGAGDANVRVLGYLNDIGPWFESVRLTVAPLRFGAGAKGKVASSLAHGVPSIVTSVASEGMSLTDQDGVLVRDTPSAFAEALVAVYSDEGRWQALSSAGLCYAERMLSLDAWQARLDAAVSLIGF
jgi:glycosyltransferase involved in cell wall biosynthesis